MKCDYPGCEEDGVRGFLKGDEDEPGKECVLIRCEGHALEAEDMVRAAALGLMGLRARPTLVRLSLGEAVVMQVMRN